MEIDRDMADRLKEARLLAGYNTIQDAVEAHRFVYSTYANHEGGHRPFLREARKYARAYRVNLTWLVNGTGAPRGRDHTHPAAEIFDSLPPELQPLALRMLKSMKDQR